MDIIEIEQKETLKRKEAATRLQAIAKMLAADSDVEFEQGGTKLKFHVPDEVHFKVELEVDTDERELEIELKW